MIIKWVNWFFVVTNHSLNDAFFPELVFFEIKVSAVALFDLSWFDVKWSHSLRYAPWEFMTLCEGSRDLGV